MLDRTFKIFDRAIEEVADIISKQIKTFKDYKRQKRIERLKKIDIAYKQKEKEIKFRKKLREELLKKELKEEEKNVKKLEKELQEVLKREQKIIRVSEKEKQKKFNEQLRIEKQLNKFKEREIREIQALQKISLQQEKSEWKNFQDKIDSIRRRYQLLRNERVKQRVEELAGAEFSDQVSIEEIRSKEKEILENKELITSTLEPFYRSIKSVLHTINLRYLPKHADLLILEDLRYEESEIIVREDSQTENFLILVYLENNDPSGKIIVENKCNEERFTTSTYLKKDIFKFGDDLIDSVIFYIQKLRQKNNKTN